MSRMSRPKRTGPLTWVSMRIAKRMMGGDAVPEPVAAQANHPRIMKGISALELAFMHSHKADEKLKHLMELKAGALCGCEWCLDFASSISAEAGVSEDQLRALPAFRDSDLFTEDEKLVLEYAEGISRTPVDVPDELFDRLRARFDDAQIVELTTAAAIENFRARFNWALGIGSQDYTADGAYCLRPESAPEKAAA